jgi:hypothetical protein
MTRLLVASTWKSTSRLLVAAALIVMALATSADAKSPVRFTPDGTTILVNKDVGTERWAISLDTERATVSGNVLIGADDARFLWCGITDALGDPTDLAQQTLVMHCFYGDPCTDVASCASGFSGWHSIGEVQIPGTFFLP